MTGSCFASVFRVWLSCLALLCACACSKKAGDAQPGSEPAASGSAPAAPAGPPLKIAYSDWPGWVAWDIAQTKGWFAEAGVPVELTWLEYVPSMEAFTAGKVDAVCVTNGDQLVTGANGAPSVAVLLNDYSNGNDMVVARPGVEKMTDLKGKKIGVELGFVSHLLLLNALKSAGMSPSDVTLVNVPTHETPQALSKGDVEAIVAWQPNSGQALKLVPGSKAIFTSADVPGIIYDVLAVDPKSLAERRDDWGKVVGVWFRIAEYLKDEKNRDEALKIMSARVGLSPAEYAPLLKGTFFLDAAGNAEHVRPGDSLRSVFHSSRVVDAFNVEHDVYKQPQSIERYLDFSLASPVAAAEPAVAKP